jgi:hypothetical protein
VNTVRGVVLGYLRQPNLRDWPSGASWAQNAPKYARPALSNSLRLRKMVGVYKSIRLETFDDKKKNNDPGIRFASYGLHLLIALGTPA